MSRSELDSGYRGPARAASDSFNISPRARWVVCPLGRTRRLGTASGLYTPGGFEKRRKKIPCSNGRIPAAWPLGQQRAGQGDLFIFVGAPGRRWPQAAQLRGRRGRRRGAGGCAGPQAR